ncbi:MAG: hypothetical protein WCD43_17930 [Candidatus Acidiferrales bacterium]
MYTDQQIDLGGGVFIPAYSNVVVANDGDPDSLAIGVTNGKYITIDLGVALGDDDLGSLGNIQIQNLEYNNGQITSLNANGVLFGVVPLPFTSSVIQSYLNNNQSVLDGLETLSRAFSGKFLQ